MRLLKTRPWFKVSMMMPQTVPNKSTNGSSRQACSRPQCPNGLSPLVNRDSMTTIHSNTNDQHVLDLQHEYRRG